MSLPDPFSELIAPFSRRGVDLGLNRIQAALAELGHPEGRFKAVQVAGTNGKGSIATMIERIVSAAGTRCGLYTSPHLLSWCERIRLPEGPIGEEALKTLLQRLQPLALRHDLTPFELITVAAFVAFAEAEVELAVLEVGLGGRLDATTVHPQRDVLAFASIGLDHVEHLGPTLEAIAQEKAAVMAPSAIAVSGPQAPEVEAVMEAQAEARTCELRWREPVASEANGGPRLGLSGALQRSNAAVAIAAAEALREKGFEVTDEAIRRGLLQARWPGRLERRQFRGQPLLIDGAHNPPAAAALRRELQPGQRRWLIGMQPHKDAPDLLRHLLEPGDLVRVVTLPEHRSWSAAELRQDVPGIEDGSSDLSENLEWLVQSERLPVACGSLYLVAALLPLLDPTD
ncbi:folylpolyglutamate synthase/dihydrofolate synthase family protein [Synechococcus sp. CB0205]|uniref:bifunctional folylpolyglutamate synthase/dihydrofolate synthase n=1 Tax=Synechococcus sp. CB0205 TaxID=232363 RepID=UPI000200231F|nr:Mur ligase family protein [Synechococcus sp. CB0205]